MFHRQSVCGLILGLTLVLLAGVFRPGEGAAPSQTVQDMQEQTNLSDVAVIGSPVPAGGNAVDPRDDQSAPGTNTSRSGGEAPGTLP